MYQLDIKAICTPDITSVHPLVCTMYHSQYLSLRSWEHVLLMKWNENRVFFHSMNHLRIEK